MPKEGSKKEIIKPKDSKTDNKPLTPEQLAKLIKKEGKKILKENDTSKIKE